MKMKELWNEKEKKLHGLNGSGRSPYDWSISKAQELGLKEIPVLGPLSWSVPGCVSGWDALQKRFGRFDLAKLLEAPIYYAREGFPVSPVIARSWTSNSIKNPTLIATFTPSRRWRGHSANIVAWRTGLTGQAELASPARRVCKEWQRHTCWWPQRGI